MKKFIVALFVIIFLQEDLIFSQIEKGNKELSIIASFMSRKFEDADESWTAINLALGFGFFITRGLEFEPEIFYSSYENDKAGWIFSGNIAYNFPTGDDNNISPFILAGLGYSNTLMYLPRFIGSGDENDKWTVLNAGAGLKIFIPYPVSLRLEYRFQKFQGDYYQTNHFILLGLSAFIK
jgi:hypothetical protein